LKGLTPPVRSRGFEPTNVSAARICASSVGSATDRVLTAWRASPRAGFAQTGEDIARVLPRRRRRPSWGRTRDGRALRGFRFASAIALRVHEAGAEYALGLVLVVRATPQPEVGDRRGAPAGNGLDVIELEARASAAAMPVRAHERALAAVACPDDASHIHRNAPLPAGRDLPGRPWLCHGSELPLLELLDQGIERPLDHLGEIARGDGMTEQRMRVPQLVVRALADGELKREPPGCIRSQPCTRYASHRGWLRCLVSVCSRATPALCTGGADPSDFSVVARICPGANGSW
jgi:hypothetical protein